MTSATPPSALATMNAGSARKKRNSVFQPALRSGGSISRSIPYEPARPVKPGNRRPIEVHERDEVRRVADVRGEEAVERVRHAPEDERDEPRDERRETNTTIDHSTIQTKWGIARKRRKNTVSRGRSRSSATTMRTGCSGSSRVRLGERGVRRRVARREQQEVAGRLRAVAERERDEVAEPARRPSAHDDRRTRRGSARRCGDAADARTRPTRPRPRSRSTPSTSPDPTSRSRSRRRARLRAGAREARGRDGRTRPTGPAARAGRSRGRRDSRPGSGTTGTGSPRGRRTRSPASRSAGTSRRTRAGSAGPRAG